MQKTYKCKNCEYEITYHSDVTIPPPKKCPQCKGTEFEEKGS